MRWQSPSSARFTGSELTRATGGERTPATLSKAGRTADCAMCPSPTTAKPSERQSSLHGFLRGPWAHGGERGHAAGLSPGGCMGRPARSIHMAAAKDGRREDDQEPEEVVGVIDRESSDPPLRGRGAQLLLHPPLPGWPAGLLHRELRRRRDQPLPHGGKRGRAQPGARLRLWRGATAAAPPPPATPRPARFLPSDQFAPELVHFAEAVATGRPAEPGGREGLADVRVIESLFASVGPA